MKAMSLRIRMATHSPGATPSAASPAAMRRTRASSACGARRRGWRHSVWRAAIASPSCCATISPSSNASAVQALGAYAVPINWHFKADEVAFVLGDCGASVLVGHADLIAPWPRRCRSASPSWSSRPARGRAAYGIPPVPPSADPGARVEEAWLAGHGRWRRRALPQLTMVYTSVTTGRPKGVRLPAPTPAHLAPPSACAASLSASRSASAPWCQARSIIPRPTRSPCAPPALPAPSP